MYVPSTDNLPISFQQVETKAKEPIPLKDDFSYQNKVLLNLFGSEEGIRNAISHLRNDRLSNTEDLTTLLKDLTGFITVDEEMIQNDPLFSLLALILNNDPNEDTLRDRAAENYISQNPEDKRYQILDWV